MDIPAMSTLKSQISINNQVGLQVAKKMLRINEQNGANLVELMESTKMQELSVNPSIGGNIDFRM